MAAILMAAISLPGFGFMLTDVLPKGVRTGAYVFAFGNDINSNFDDSGTVVSLVNPLNLSLGMNELAQFDSSGDLKLAQQKINELHPNAYGDQILAANIYSNISVSERRHVFAFLYGVTEKFTLQVALPIQSRRVKVDFRAEVTNHASEIADKIGNVPYMYEGLKNDLGPDALTQSDFIQGIFLDNGYKLPGTYEWTELGEIQIEGRYRYFKDDYFAFGTRLGATLPTSTHDRDVHNLFDSDFGDETLAIRAASIHEVRPIPGLINLHSAVVGTYRFPTVQTMAVPLTAEQNLPNTSDVGQIVDVRRDLGASVDVEVGAMFDIYGGTVSFDVTYQYSLRAMDRFSGAAPVYYGYLMKPGASELHGVEFTAELSSIYLFLKEISPVPAKLWITWYQPLRGRNVTYAPYGTVNIAMLF